MEKQAKRKKFWAQDRRRLLAFERDAVNGRKLGPRDRLIAAFHLTRAWSQANASGLRKEDFQDAVLIGLKRQHASRQQFRLVNWTLRRGEDPRSEDLRLIYDGRSTPQLALEPYLVGIAIAAQQCGEDPDQWKLAMMRELSIWGQNTTGLEVQPADDRPMETLAMLVSAMCSALGRRNRLQEVFDAISGMNCRWEMFGDKLVANDTVCMQRWQGPVIGQGDYFEEAFPFPSVSLVRVPYLQRNTSFTMAREAEMDAREAGHTPIGAAQGHLSPSAITEELQGNWEATGQLRLYRDIRLCILPDGHGGYVAGLESRPHVEVYLDRGHALQGPRTVVGGFEPDLREHLFYARTAKGNFIWPHVLSDEGEAWRIRISDHVGSQGLLAQDWTERDPCKTGWRFDADPIGAPGGVFAEPWDLSYTPATPDYLRHWLTNAWKLGELSEQCDWNRSEPGRDGSDADSRWNVGLPPIMELNFPVLNSATLVECCLHNGLIEEALQASIDRLKVQTAELQADWEAARDRNAQSLLVRWHISRDADDNP